METNILSILYLSYRLSPFILVCFFSLSSIINQDFKGLVYLSGLLLTTFFSIIVGNLINKFNMFQRQSYTQDSENQNATKVCNILNLTKGGYLSFLPLSLIVFSYTFAYLMTIIYKYHLIFQNIPIMIIFAIIIFYDIYWNFDNQCVNVYLLGFTLFFGLLFGMIWAFIIDSLKMAKLQYFSGLSNNEVCSLPSTQTFKCKKRNL